MYRSASCGVSRTIWLRKAIRSLSLPMIRTFSDQSSHRRSPCSCFAADRDAVLRLSLRLVGLSSLDFLLQFPTPHSPFSRGGQTRIVQPFHRVTPPRSQTKLRSIVPRTTLDSRSGASGFPVGRLVCNLVLLRGENYFLAAVVQGAVIPVSRR